MRLVVVFLITGVHNCHVGTRIKFRFHFMNADAMAPMAFGSSILVYLTGVALILAAVSMFIGKYDKLAALLLGVFLILVALIVHLGALNAGDQNAMGQILKDVALAGAAWMYAGNMAKDNSIIG